MKIVCDACAAKYSIADEKVAGKVFKIRCKKCSNVIVVRGTAEAEAAPELEQKETRVFDYSGYDNPQDAVAAAEASISDGAVWHIVIDQEQVGPLTPEEVRAHAARGDIDGESFIWREGFADWERVDSLAEFADLAAGGNVDDAAAAMFGGPSLDEGMAAADPADLFTAQSAEPMAAIGAAADTGGGGLFGGAADDGGLFGGASAAAAAEPAMMASPAEEKLKGQRNENSVLFSLNNLASLASDSKPAASSSSSASASPAAAAGGMAQAGGQEGSGLIDIRAMASMYVGNNDNASSAPAASIDDLPVFSQPAITSASPVLMPVAAPANNNKLLVALIAGIGALVLVAVLLVILVLRGGGDDDEPKTAANTATNGATQGDGDGDGDTKPKGDGDGDGDGDKTPTDATNPPVDDGAAKAAAEAEKAAKAEAARLKKEEEKRAREERLKNETPSQRRARERKEKKEREERKKKAEERKRKAAEAKAKADAAKASKGNSKGGCDELDCLVNPNKSCCKKKGGSSSSSSSNSSLPDRPPKSSLGSGMGKAKGSASSCAKKAGFKGTVSVRVRVSGNGRASSASASGGKGSVNSCVASAVKRRARFPKSKNGISFTYKFRL